MVTQVNRPNILIWGGGVTGMLTALKLREQYDDPQTVRIYVVELDKHSYDDDKEIVMLSPKVIDMLPTGAGPIASQNPVGTDLIVGAGNRFSLVNRLAGGNAAHNVKTKLFGAAGAGCYVIPPFMDRSGKCFNADTNFDITTLSDGLDPKEAHYIRTKVQEIENGILKGNALKEVRLPGTVVLADLENALLACCEANCIAVIRPKDTDHALWLDRDTVTSGGNSGDGANLNAVNIMKEISVFEYAKNVGPAAAAGGAHEFRLEKKRGVAFDNKTKDTIIIAGSIESVVKHGNDAYSGLMVGAGRAQMTESLLGTFNVPENMINYSITLDIRTTINAPFADAAGVRDGDLTYYQDQTRIYVPKAGNARRTTVQVTVTVNKTEHDALAAAATFVDKMNIIKGNNALSTRIIKVLDLYNISKHANCTMPDLSCIVGVTQKEQKQFKSDSAYVKQAGKNIHTYVIGELYQMAHPISGMGLSFYCRQIEPLITAIARGCRRTCGRGISWCMEYRFNNYIQTRSYWGGSAITNKFNTLIMNAVNLNNGAPPANFAEKQRLIHQADIDNIINHTGLTRSVLDNKYMRRTWQAAEAIRADIDNITKDNMMPIIKGSYYYISNNLKAKDYSSLLAYRAIAIIFLGMVATYRLAGVAVNGDVDVMWNVVGISNLFNAKTPKWDTLQGVFYHAASELLFDKLKAIDKFTYDRGISNERLDRLNHAQAVMKKADELNEKMDKLKKEYKEKKKQRKRRMKHNN